jgi:uncharacterized protein YgiM (DUF1202 family)
MTARKVRVTVAFPPNFFDGLTQPPLNMRRGEVLQVVEKEKSERWPTFVLVVNESGGRGWVPERHLRRQGKEAVATLEYDTTTLNPSKGDILTVLKEDNESGWLWCRDPKGKEGWFAIDSVAPV